MLTVAQLIEVLSEYDGNLLVVSAKDMEGNGFHYVQDVEYGLATKNDDWCLDIVHPDDVLNGEYEKWDAEANEYVSTEPSDYASVVTLW